MSAGTPAPDMPGSAALRFARMDARTVDDAERLLAAFLAADAHYRAEANAYGDGGREALLRALELFVAHPHAGFVWLAHAPDGQPVAACVVSHAISTSRGGWVAKLDDVTVARGWQGRGAGTALLRALVGHLAGQGFGRIDTACHRDNARAWRFYARLGFRPLHEERLALLL